MTETDGKQEAETEMIEKHPMAEHVERAYSSIKQARAELSFPATLDADELDIIERRLTNAAKAIRDAKRTLK